MDESRHPERDNASINTGNAFSNEEIASTGDSSQTDAQSASKRPHSDDTSTEPSAKKAHVDAEVHEDDDVADELDLDALMAQLQQHTEKATGESANKDTAAPENEDTSDHETLAFNVDSIENVLKDLGSTEHSHSETNKDETELSIEQQLKGALSSLEFEGDDDIGLEQLSQLLKTTDEKKDDKHASNKTDTKDTEKETEESVEKAGDEQSAASGVPAEGTDTKSTLPEVQGETRIEAAEAPTAPEAEHRETSTHASEVSEVSEVSEAKQAPEAIQAAAQATAQATTETTTDATTEATEPTSRRESLISKMPPPPVLHGQLPPMPPPPAAFTSPVAPYALSESRESEGADAGSSAAVSATRPASQVPVFSDAPAPLSDEYKKNLIEQLETASKEPQESETEDKGNMENRENEVDEQDSDDKEDKDTAEDQELNGRPEDETGNTSSDNAAPRPIPALFLNDNKAILQSRRRSLLLLDSLACQVLETLSFSHYQETLSTVMQPESERGMVYRILLDAFEDVKRIYMKWETHSSRITPQPKPEGSRPFLPYNLAGVEPTRDNLITIQRANMATFVAALFGSIEIGFWELDDWFIRVFVPENGRLLKQQANIYLDLKTQAYISAVESTDDKEAHKAALEHLFPIDLETKMQYMFGVRIHLAPTEKDFVAKCHRRRDNILSENNADLPTKYHWVPFLREVSDYISRNHLTLLPPRKYSILPGEAESGVHPASSNVADAGTSSITTTRNYPVPRRQAPAPSSRASTVQPPGSKEDKREADDVEVTSVKPSTTGGPAKVEITDSVQSSSDVTKSGSHYARTDQGREASASVVGSSPASGTPTAGTSATGSPSGTPTAGTSAAGTPAAGTPSGTPAPGARSASKPLVPSEGHPMFPPLPKQVLPPPTSGSSSPLPDSDRLRRPGPKPHTELPPPGKHSDTLAAYEAAKASAEGTDAIRPKTSMFTTRRTWTKQEEEALLKGMDRVQGPYWAQILELYGPGGKISEVLKDRSQVQLKDKARNLKMFFVRLGLPIPAVFQYVTGDYETRRTSGKKMRDRRQQQQQQQQQLQQQPPRAGPSGFSQVHNPAPQPIRDTQKTGHIPEGNNIQGNTTNTTDATAKVASNATTHPTSNPTSNPSQTIESAEDSQKQTNQPSATQDPTPDSKQMEHTISKQKTPEHSTGKSPEKNGLGHNIPATGQSAAEQGTGELEQRTSEQSAPAQNAEEPVQRVPAQGTQAQVPKETGHDTIGNPGDPATHPESSSTDADGKFADIFGDSNDKDDLNTLLNRVGEYVDNH